MNCVRKVAGAAAMECDLGLRLRLRHQHGTDPAMRLAKAREHCHGNGSGPGDSPRLGPDGSSVLRNYEVRTGRKPTETFAGKDDLVCGGEDGPVALELAGRGPCRARLSSAVAPEQRGLHRPRAEHLVSAEQAEWLR